MPEIKSGSHRPRYLGVLFCDIKYGSINQAFKRLASLKRWLLNGTTVFGGDVRCHHVKKE